MIKAVPQAPGARIAAVQVLPIHAQEDGSLIPLPEGATPDLDISFWGVYLREGDGTASWVADCVSENVADGFAAGLAALYGVSIEPYTWKQIIKETA